MLLPCCPGPAPPGRCSGPPVCTLCVSCCVYGVLGLLAPVHWFARSVCGDRVYGVLCLLAPVHHCARSVCGVACTVPWASWLLFTGVHAQCVVLRVRCPGPLGSCSPACTLSVLCCVRGVLGRLASVHRCVCSGGLCRVYGVLSPLAPVHRCARFVCGVVCAASWASWLLFTDARARRVLLACFLSPSLILACSSACSSGLSSCFFSPSRPRGALGVRIRVSVCGSPPFRPLLLLFPPGSCPPCAPPHLTLLLPLLSAILSPPLQSVPVRAPSSHPRPILLLLLSLPTSCSFSSRFASSLLLVLPLPFLALVLVLLSVSLRRRLLLLVCRPRPSISGPPCPRTFQSRCVASRDVPVRGTGRTPGLFVVFPPLPRTLQSMAAGSPPDDPVRGLGPCFIPPRILQSRASFCPILSVASDAPSRRAGFTPGRSSPRLVPCFVPPRMLHSGASFYGIISVASDAPGSPPADPVRGPGPCSTPPWMLQSGASVFCILSVAPGAPVRGTGFTPRRSSPGASAVRHSAPDAQIWGVCLSYSLCCPGRSSPWHRFHPRTIQSGG